MSRLQEAKDLLAATEGASSTALLQVRGASRCVRHGDGSYHFEPEPGAVEFWLLGNEERVLDFKGLDYDYGRNEVAGGCLSGPAGTPEADARLIAAAPSLRELLAAMVAEVEQLQALLSLAKDLSDAVDDYDDEEDEVTCFALYAAIPEANAKFQREFYREVRGGR